MERKQFTFYDSFFEGISRIRKKAERCDAYDAIVRYALKGEEPDLDSLPDAAVLAFVMARPNLDASRKKAENGSKGGASKTEANESKQEANGKQTAKKPKQEKEQEKEQEKDKDKEQMLKETTQRKADEAFERFWSAYPRKVGKLDARKSWDKIYGGPMRASAPTVDSVVEAVERQKMSDQWTRDNGQYIPHPATWLNQGRWEDELPVGRGDGLQHHGAPVSPMMQAAIKAMMEEPDE